MQYRSSNRVLWLSILTLGIYELLWLSRTRKEMVTRGVKIPKMAYMVVLRIATLVLLVLIVQLAWVWLIHTEGSITVSQACWSEYVLSNDPGDGPPVTLSDKCRNELAASDAANARQTHQLQELPILLVVGLAVTYGTNKWLAYYAGGVEKVTNDKMSGTTAALALMVLPFSVGAATVQTGFNQSSKRLT